MALPKNHREQMRLRAQATGDLARRKNMTRILDKSATFPKGVVLADIDQTFTEWVEKELYIVYDGEVLPTYKLFSNQRVNEYAQNWAHLDTVGNPIMNFKGISRENNPKKGENQGSVFNVPGNRDYIMGYKPVLQENGTEAYDLYTMKQPVSVDIVYTITLITNKYMLLNKMNELMNTQFSALEKYIFPNGHAMPMKLDDVSDESEYGIDDRKYYAQSYRILLKAYIVDPEGFKITHLPSRMRIQTPHTKKKNKDSVKVTVDDWNCIEEAPSPFENQTVNIQIDFPSCHKTVDFSLDTELIISEIELDNVHDFVLYINEELQDFDSENEIKFYIEDGVHIEIERDDPFNESHITIKCLNPNVIYDTRENPESSLDEKNFDLDIEIKNGESE